ncbi:hypothetical protein DL96DRAFT_1215385 [Flagelloscypha sp. PMI_526]|nr:hypothetical protein DL96DRAFT_1215385 [Flagelloscypha sp. PMI_526]
MTSWRRCPKLRRFSSTSSSKTQFPFPTNPRPSPHQIFHLKSTASPAEVKARYYDLVRVHHPDRPSTHHLDFAERQRRFQAIQSAYDVLRGKVSSTSHSDGGGADWSAYAAELARRRAYADRNSRRPSSHHHHHDWGFQSQRDWTATASDQWKDRAIIYFAVACVMIGFLPSFFYGPKYVNERHKQAVRSLNVAREEAMEVHDERQRRLKEYWDSVKDEEKHSKPPEQNSPPPRLV